MLSRPHPALGWLYITPSDTRRVMDRLLRDRDAAVEADPTHTGLPQPFVQWTWETWLPSHINRYAKQIEEHIRYLDQKYGASLGALRLLYDILLSRRLDNEAIKARRTGWGYRHGSTSS